MIDTPRVRAWATALRVCGLGLLCCAALACGQRQDHAPAQPSAASKVMAGTPSAEVPSAAAPSPAVAPPPAAERAVAKVAQRTGEVWTYQPGHALADALLYARGTPIGTGADGQLSLDFEDGARVTLEPGSIAVLVPYEPAALLLVQGSLHASVPPQPKAARAPLRVASSELAVSVARSAELWLQVPLAGGNYLAVLSGDAELETWPEHATDAVVTPLSARHAASCRSDVVSLAVGPANLAAAHARHASPQRPASGNALLQRLQAFDAAYERSAAQQARLHATAEEQRAQQRAAHTRGDSAAVAALQASLVQGAQQLVQARAALVHHYERRLALLYTLDALHTAAPQDVHDLAAAFGTLQDEGAR